MVDQLEKRVDRLEEENASLRSRLDKNSTNSSKPPSTDSFSKPARKAQSLRESSGKPQGKQTGSGGTSLPITATPGQVLRHEPTTCRGCGSSLRGRDHRCEAAHHRRPADPGGNGRASTD
ncbi:DUF6444 domain-containing protein [Cryobacterium sp. Hh7]|uniref:DUF6444 domain-containing protein n=1 Tax=Cryobacterium sp. Hh7 TaxID=1259159 RepID=UPI00351A2A40